MAVLGYLNGLPVFETRAIVHDPHSGQFTSGAGSSGTHDHQWAPHMTPEAAHKWAKGSAFEGKTFLHFTDAKHVSSILQHGLEPKPAQFGTCVFLTDKNAATAGGRGSASAKLEVVVNAKNALHFNHLREVAAWGRAHGLDPGKNDDIWAHMAKKGHDAASIKFADGETWVAVLHKSAVTVIGHHTVEPTHHH